MADNELIEVVYTGKKVFRLLQGKNSAARDILPGERFECTRQTYLNMSDVLQPANVYDANQLAVEAQRLAAKEAADQAEAEALAARRGEDPEDPEDDEDEDDDDEDGA